MKANKTLAIIGLGNIGTAVAENLSRSARSFIVSGRQLDRVAKAAERWGLTAARL